MSRASTSCVLQAKMWMAGPSPGHDAYVRRGPMLTFVLIHGAWHDGSCWGEVAAHLRNGGHVVHAPTIAGNGRNADRRVNHAACTKSIVDFIVSHDLGDVILVGHSYGGTIIAKVA